MKTLQDLGNNHHDKSQPQATSNFRATVQVGIITSKKDYILKNQNQVDIIVYRDRLWPLIYSFYSINKGTIYINLVLKTSSQETEELLHSSRNIQQLPL